MVPPPGAASKTVITFSRRGKHQAAGKSAQQCQSPRELSDCDPHSQESESIAFTEASPGSPSTFSDGRCAQARGDGPRSPQQSPSQPVRQATLPAADPFAFPDEPDALVPLPAALQALAVPETPPENACRDKAVPRNLSLEENEPAGIPLPIRRHPIVKPVLVRPLSGSSPGAQALPAAAAQRCPARLQLPGSSAGQRGSSGSQPGAGCFGNAGAEASGGQQPAAETQAETLQRGVPDWLQPTADKVSCSTETTAPRAHQSGGAHPARAPTMLLSSKRKAATLGLADLQVCPSVWPSFSARTSCCASGTYGLAMGQHRAVPDHCCSLQRALHTHSSHILVHAGCMGGLRVMLHERRVR